VKAGRSVVFSTLADLITSLAKAEREGSLRERIRYLCRAQLLIVDEIGYLPVVPGGGNPFFQLVNVHLLHHAVVIQIEGSSYRLRQHTDLVPEHIRAKALTTPAAEPKRRGRPPRKKKSDPQSG